MWWMLAREVLRLRGTISREVPWEVMPDLYFYRDPEEVHRIFLRIEFHTVTWNLEQERIPVESFAPPWKPYVFPV